MSKEDNFHRIALEPRSGIWLMFYEKPLKHNFYKNLYEQQLLRIFTSSYIAKKTALRLIKDRKITTPLVVRDDSKKNEMFREG